MTADDMEAPDDKPHGLRWGRLRAIILAIMLLLLIALIALWTQRKPIATNYIDKALAARGVPARYQIADLGLDRQRLTNVVIGDPAHPDLVADWIELRASLGLSGVSVTAISAGHVRMNARLIGGKLSLGAIDKLMPAPSNKPFTLPTFYADIEDARIRLVSPQGLVGLKLSGKGRLNDGFAGQIAAVSNRLDLGGCVAGRATAVFSIRIRDARPSLTGPARLDRLDCAGMVLAKAGADVSVALNDGLDHWQGMAELAVASVDHPKIRVRAIAAALDFTGSAANTAGDVHLKSGPFGSAIADGAALTAAGQFRLVPAGLSFVGRAGGRSVAASPATRAGLARLRAMGAGTPVGPLVERFATASEAAARAVDIDAAIGARVVGGKGRLLVSQLSATAASGAHITVAGTGIGYEWPGSAVRFDGTIITGGGNMPEAAVRVSQAVAGGPVTGTATFKPYAAGNALLALAPVSFTATPGGVTRVKTRITLSGPLGDGRVDHFTMPVTALWDGRDRVQVNRDCAPLSFDRLAVSGLTLRSSTVALCPVDGALLRFEHGRLGGGARLGATRLGGALGSTPIEIASTGMRFGLADQKFAVTGLGVRIGTPARQTHLDFATLNGKLKAGAIDGSFGGGGGQIANVPLLLSGAQGTWNLHGGKLGVLGALQVADAAPDPRFKPLAAHDVALTLAGGTITTTGKLVQPDKNIAVADMAIVHDLGRGVGHADLTVPGITFDSHFQPEELTRLTFGVIADVVGKVSGEGHIRWDGSGVTSDGVFRTTGTDLAAAFGPATGIAGEIRFTDLLNLETAPGQVATIKTVNPGIAVNDGTIRYQLLAGTRIQIEEGRWPFAGGVLMLEPTLLNFGEHMERRMTFRVSGMDAGQFLQQFDFKNLNATGLFDGVLPMIFDEKGGRIEDGHLRVRPGGGTIAYVGEISQKDLGFWGNLAFQALKALRYRSLEIVMNGPLAGEMITEVRFAGIGQGVGAKRNFLIDRLQKLPLVFNLRIKAPFRGLIDSAQSFYDPKRLIQRNLPVLLEEQKKRAKPPGQAPSPIQPPESRKMP